MLKYQEIAAKRMEEIAKYRDAPVVAELTQYGVITSDDVLASKWREFL